MGVLSEPDDADKIVRRMSWVAGRGATTGTVDDIRDALLTAAGIIRQLHITLETET
jgi:hypothetical protein